MNVNFALLIDEKLIVLDGQESRTFLQGQATCDVRQLSSETALQGLLCTPKGRVLTDFLLFDLEEEKIGLRVKQDLVETTCTTLRKYAMFSKTEIYSEPDCWQVVGCWGSDAKELVYHLTNTKITKKCSVADGNGVKAIQIDEVGEHFELFVKSERLDHVKEILKRANEVNGKQWAKELIKLGVCRLTLDTSDQHVPQVLNYDLIDFISFKKGCYTGQEIIARLKYRGVPKRRCVLATCEVEKGIVPGATIYCIDKEITKGVIINTALDSEKKSFSLLVALPRLKENVELRAFSHTGPKLQLGVLPYDVTFDNP